MRSVVGGGSSFLARCGIAFACAAVACGAGPPKNGSVDGGVPDGGAPDAGVPDGGVTACFSSTQCPNGGAPRCVANAQDYWTCGNDGYGLHWVVDCSATGQTCQNGACRAQPCASPSECLNGGEPYCDGNTRILWTCETGGCVRSVTDCAVMQKLCISGNCQVWPPATDGGP